MHIPAHALDPITCAATGAISTAAIGYALYRVKHESIGSKLPHIVLTGAGILAAQALNYPIGVGASGHFLGGCLAAILLGPWAGMLVMAAVVAVQALIFQDGGVDALGANILNMAVVGTGVGHFVFARVKVALAESWGSIVAASIAAWCSVVAGAALCSVELSWGAGYPVIAMLTQMLPMHSLIGLGEGLVTATIIAAVARGAVAKLTWHTAIGLICAVVAWLALVPFASRLPDGLEFCLSQIRL